MKINVPTPHMRGIRRQPPNPKETYDDPADLNSPVVRLLQERVHLESTRYRPATLGKLTFHPNPPTNGNELLASIALLDDIDMVSNVAIQERIQKRELTEDTPDSQTNHIPRVHKPPSTQDQEEEYGTDQGSNSRPKKYI